MYVCILRPRAAFETTIKLLSQEMVHVRTQSMYATPYRTKGWLGFSRSWIVRSIQDGYNDPPGTTAFGIFLQVSRHFDRGMSDDTGGEVTPLWRGEAGELHLFCYIYFDVCYVHDRMSAYNPLLFGRLGRLVERRREPVVVRVGHPRDPARQPAERSVRRSRVDEVRDVEEFEDLDVVELAGRDCPRGRRFQDGLFGRGGRGGQLVGIAETGKSRQYEGASYN